MLDMIGEGSYGVVFRAIDTTTGMTVAVKKLLSPYSETARKNSMQREITALQLLKHPNLMQLVEVIQDEKNVYLITNCMPTNLKKALDVPSNRQHFATDLRYMRHIMYQLLRATNYMHKMGMFNCIAELISCRICTSRFET